MWPVGITLRILQGQIRMDFELSFDMSMDPTKRRGKSVLNNCTENDSFIMKYSFCFIIDWDLIKRI